MRVLVLVKASKESEAGKIPPRELLEEMGKFNEELVKAGVLLAADGLKPSSKGARVRFEGKKRTVIDGPFTETKELVAGFWLWQVRSLDEAIEWLKRAPFGGGMEVEIRPLHEMEDFGAELTPEIQKRAERVVKKAVANKKAASRKK
jgi:hypothetical protein